MTSTPHTTNDLGFGRKLTREEYNKETIALHTSPNGHLNPQAKNVRQREIALMIDYHLGIDFPEDRREALWRAQQSLDRRKYWHLARGLMANRKDPFVVMIKAQIQAFAKLLTRDELKALIGLTDQEIERFL